jgi:hypothetical protein
MAKKIPRSHNFFMFGISVSEKDLPVAKFRHKNKTWSMSFSRSLDHAWPCVVIHFT